MSDSESSDGLAELHDIIRDFDEKNPTTAVFSSKQSSITSTETSPEPPIKKFRNVDYLEKIILNKKEDLYENLAIVATDYDEDINKSRKKRKPVWHDSDDDDYDVSDIYKDTKKRSYSHLRKDKKFKEHLTEKFLSVQAPPKWADLDRERDVDSDEELLKTIGHIAPNSVLKENIIEMKKLKDLNRTTYAEGSITSVQFHPTSTVGLVAGYSGVVSLYAIDGIKNVKLHNINFKNFPIKYAKFHNNGQNIIAGSNKKYFYNIDLMTGKEQRVFLPDAITKLSLFDISPCGKYLVVAGRFGEIHLMDIKSKELIYTYKQECECTNLQFQSDSLKIVSHSKSPEVAIFDIRKQKIQHVFTDDGCISGKTIAISPNKQMLATGSNEGVVNVYNYNDVFLSKLPKPQKIIYNLTTSISVTKFNHSSEILGISSEFVSGACKLVHFPSATVFSNFPGQNTNIGHVTALDFSPSSGYMVLGNRKKEAPLFRLKHFKNY